jgi:UDP-glucose 4-epimerase
MTSGAAWILGAGGLLGGALRAALRERADTHLHEPAARMAWTDGPAVAAQLADGARAFAALVRAESAPRWTVLWAAGQGTMGSTTPEMQRETASLSALLRALAEAPELRGRPGALLFASTAGGIYAGSREETITELSPTAPTSPYGHEKLQQERLVATWAASLRNVAVLSARISTLYGPGQTRNKRQGLISHIARSALRHDPVNIFVPLDTIRDYLHVGDAARDMLVCLDELAAGAARGVTTKIIASEEATTIAQIVGQFAQILRKRPSIITSAHPLGAQYVRRICFRSVVMPHARDRRRTSLLIGVSEVMAHERLALAAAGC